jgi:cAMP-dependent protein kinase regulator
MSLEIERHEISEVVFRKGDRGEYFYIVLEGIYYVETENQKDKRKEKSIYYYPGDSFGEVSLIYDVPRGATIIANKESSLIKVPKVVFNECGNL